MREYMGVAMNASFVANDEDVVRGLAETILLYTEPTYTVDAGGAVVRRREVGSFRLMTDPKGLRDIAKRFAEWADEIEEQQRRINGEGAE
jgi:hypothetical protein